MQQCIYVSASWGIHDVRWFNALGQIGFDPIACRLGYEASDIQSARAVLRNISNPEMPILAGPLHTVTRHLLGVPGRLVGLSWGFDMYEADDLTWLSGLDGLIVDSHATQEIAESSGLASERITFMPWGVDLTQFSPNGPARKPEELDLPDNSRIVLSLRAHEALYRVGDIIEGFALVSERHPNAVLVIGNEGSLTAALQQQVNDLGITNRVRFLGRISEDTLPPLLRSAAVYVSASEVDGTSVTLLQAMACATPVLASKNAGNVDWIHTDTGSLFETGNITQLAERLDSLLLDPEHAKALSRNAHPMVQEQADWHRNINRLGQVMRRATT